jgi:hypothetical protein
MSCAQRLAIGRDFIRRIACTLALLVASAPVHSQTEPQHPSSLPAMDWTCYVSFGVAFAPADSINQDLRLDGDNNHKPRIELRTVDNGILSVVENAGMPLERTKFEVDLSKITEDFTHRNPVYAWRQELGYEAKIFALNVNDRLLSLTKVMKPPSRAPNENQVFVCK